MKGFTLVELIVTILIMMLLVGIGTVSINGFINSKKLEGVTSELIDQIKLARNLAVTGQLPDGGSGLIYVKVKITPNNGMIEASDDNNNDYFNKKIDGLALGVGVSFGFAINTGRLTDFNGAFVDVDNPLNIGVSGVGVTKTVTINNLGVINGN